MGELPILYLVRHGETAWSISGQHTGRTDLPLTARGEYNAGTLRYRLAGLSFAQVFRSPLRRTTRTCELAGFGGVAEPDSNLVEWDYGDYEGLRTAEIHAHQPDWLLFRDGCPGGESPVQIAARADAVRQRVCSAGGRTLIFSSGHFSRVLAMRWLGLELVAARFFALDPASVSILGFENDWSRPIVSLWNDVGHLGPPSRQGRPVDAPTWTEPVSPAITP